MHFDRSAEMNEIDKISKQSCRKLPDSGERRQFDSGAVRDISNGKGRCDLLPLDTLSNFFAINGEFSVSDIFESISAFIRTGIKDYIYFAIKTFIDHRYNALDEKGSIATSILDLSKHYEDGANKYSERNWEKGIPCHCYVDSGVRHLLKYYRGDNDEPHDRAFLWNMFGLLWTIDHKPDMNDLPFKEIDCDE